MEVELNNSNFDNIIFNGKVLVDFWAVWCGPCQMIAGEVDKIAKEFEGKITVAKVNVDSETDIALKYNIEVIPTLVLIENGKEVKRTSGYMTATEIKEFFNL